MNRHDKNRNQIAIIGAGPAGLQAAIAAATAGAKVVLIDSYSQLGGQFYKQMPASFHKQATDPHQDEAAALIAQLPHQQITYHLQTQTLGIAKDGRTLWLNGRDAPAELEAAAIILATGAYDRPAAFPGWTLPGVLSLGAAQTVIKEQRILPGKNLLLAGSGPLLLATGAALTKGGARVVGVLEATAPIRRLRPRHWRTLRGQGNRLREGWRYLRALQLAKTPYRLGWGIVEALGTPETGVTGAIIAPLDAQWQPVMKKARQIQCDTICIGYGFIPETALGRLSGAVHTYQAQQGGWVPVRDRFLQTTVPGLYAVGDGAGIGGAAQAALEGQIAGTAAASFLQTPSNKADLTRKIQPLLKKLAQQRDFQRVYGRLFTPEAGFHTWSRADTLLCRCENVTQAAVVTAVNHGAHTVTAVKGITRAGMGACQGRLCSHLIAGQIARTTGSPITTCGQLNPRAPIHPLLISDAVTDDKQS